MAELTETPCKELPILVSPELVRAYLEGRKTQTRRIIKPQPIRQHWIDKANMMGDRREWAVLTNYANVVSWLPCPYGKPGDKLWVRERWAVHGALYDDLPPSGIHCSVKGGCWEPGDSIWYLADGENSAPATGKCSPSQRGKWRNSIHMPRWACRLVLDVVDIRVERLQSITSEDARAEGFQAGERASETDAFHNKWEELHGPDSWDANPWVWVVETKRVSDG